jgi:hypothetical protein
MCIWPQNKKSRGLLSAHGFEEKNYKSIHGQTSPPEIKEIKKLP